MPTTLIADIQRFSVHDGPGIRTVVFLKGCPLHCTWCHNPECISFEQQILRYPEKCIGCGQCADGCFAGARVVCGREMTPAEVLREILQDRAYYGTTGGVTISGGEPLAHPEFAKALLRLCRDAGIGTALETSLYRYDEKLLALADTVMTDIKIWDPELHRRHTGIDNREILENIRRLDTLGIPFTVRTPIIPTVNDTVENVRNTADFLRTLRHITSYELLPYHPLGIAKARALGLNTTEFPIPTKEHMEELKHYADIH